MTNWDGGFLKIMMLRDLYFLTSSVSTSRIKLAKYWFTLSHPSSWVSMNSFLLPRQLPRHCLAPFQVFLCSILKLQLLLATNGDNRPSPEFLQMKLERWKDRYQSMEPELQQTALGIKECDTSLLNPNVFALFCYSSNIMSMRKKSNQIAPS